MLKILLIAFVILLSACATVPLVVEKQLPKAVLITSQHPIYYFNMGDEIFQCLASAANQPIKCIGQNKKTFLTLKYLCSKTTEANGYIKDCEVLG
jgi:hypothetical protein